MAVNDLGFPGLGVLLAYLRQLLHHDLADAGWLLQGVFQILDLPLQCLRLLHPLEDVLLVDVAELDLRHVFRLLLVDAEADHQVGDDLGLLLRLPDDGDGLVDVQQDALQTQQQMQLLLLAGEDEVHPPPHTLRAPCDPLLQQGLDSQHTGHPGDEDVEVAAEGVLQRCQLIQLLHQLLRVHPPLEVDGELQAAEVRLVPHIADLLDLAGLHQLRHLVQDHLDGGGVGDLEDLDEILLLVVAPAGPNLDAAPAGAVNFRQLRRVAHQLSAGGKIRRQQGGGDVMVGIFQQGDGGVAHLRQIEAADLRGHTHGDALIG